MFVWNRLPNHAYYGDKAFAGDSVGLGLGQRLNFIKKIILRYFWGKVAPDEKKLFEQASPQLILRLSVTNMTPLANEPP